VTAEILLPRLSDSMDEGTILQWLKSVGDRVALGDELVEIETDKAAMIFEASAAGVVVELVAAEGATLPIGAVIARIGSEASRIEPFEPAPPTAEAADNGADPTPPAEDLVSDEPPPTSTTGGFKASPLARRTASGAGVDLAGLSGTGPGGRIRMRDVKRALAPGSAPAEPTLRSPLSQHPAAPSREQADTTTAKGRVEIVDPTRLQATVARRMAESKANVPHFYLQTVVDMSVAVAARDALRQRSPDGAIVPSFNDMVVKACALALREFPRANGAYRDGRFELYERVNIGIAVAADDGLVVPTIFDADEKGLARIATVARELATKVRQRTITPPELSGGTFTVSNLGMFGMTSIGPVISSPQAAILGVGEIAERPVAPSGQVAIAKLMDVSLSCDHRILYGADGARFLALVRTLLEQPLGLAL
jgi:pyruvate dehydrogenase E2 component (dihydrolipoamide acetyltransferase)